MFSMTTIELSTSMPMPIARPDIEMTFIVTPEKYIRTSANRTETGIEMPTIRVGRRSRRNRKRIKIASAAPISRFSTTDEIAIWMKSPWLISDVNESPGYCFSSSRKRASTLSETVAVGYADCFENESSTPFSPLIFA